MIFSDEAALAAHIKEKKPLNVYWLYGDEDYLLDYYTKRLLLSMDIKSGADMGAVKFDGKTPLDEIIAEAITPSWFAERKCVIVDDFPIYSQSAAQAEEFFEFVNSVPDFSVVIFKNLVLDKKTRKGAGFASAVKKMQKFCGIAELLKRDDKGIVKFLKYEINKRGCDISPADCRYFIERCGTDMYLLAGELEKLCVAKKEGVITKGDIENYTVPVLESGVYDMTGAISRGNYKMSMKTLDELLWQRVEPIAIVAALSGMYIDLYRAKIAKESGKGKDDILKLYDYKSTAFRVENALRDCGGYTLKSIADSLEVLREADVALKGSAVDKTVILQRTVTKLFECRKK